MTILSWSQTDSSKIHTVVQDTSCKITHTCKQFKFYAQAVSDRKWLIADSTSRGIDQRESDKIIYQQKEEKKEDIEIQRQQVKMVKNCEKGFQDLSVKYLKSEKKVKNYKQTTLIGGVVICILGTIVILK